MTWLETLPLIAVGLIIFALLIAGMELGYRSLGWFVRGQADGQRGSPDHLLSAVLGLLALLLGFTFSLALNRYEARRDLVTQEANAIGTTWLRAELLEEPNRTALTGLLRDYADVRLAWSETDARVASLAPTSAAQQKLWAATGTAIHTDPSPQLTRALMDAMNESFDLASARAVARSTHIPGEVLRVLLLYAALSAVMLGYVMAASGRPHRGATILLLLLVTMALILILDVDRPLNGAIRISQQPLVDLRRGMMK